MANLVPRNAEGETISAAVTATNVHQPPQFQRIRPSVTKNQRAVRTLHPRASNAHVSTATAVRFDSMPRSTQSTRASQAALQPVAQLL